MELVEEEADAGKFCVNSNVPTPRLVLPLSDHLQTIVEKSGGDVESPDVEVTTTDSPPSSKSPPAAVVPEFQTDAATSAADSASSTSIETATVDTTVSVVRLTRPPRWTRRSPWTRRETHGGHDGLRGHAVPTYSSV